MTGMCGPKSGVWKMTLTVILRDSQIRRDPYSDLTVELDTLTLTFRCSFFNENNSREAPQAKIFLNHVCWKPKMPQIKKFEGKIVFTITDQ